jgi:hypothetical protein
MPILVDLLKTINEIFCAVIREGKREPFILKIILARLISGFGLGV